MTKSFETERTRQWRTSELNPEDDETISHVENFGCSIIHIDENSAGPGWSFTLGVFDTAGKPEIIVVGLKRETAHHLLNEAARLLRSGVELTRGRHKDLLGNVECEFRPVDQKWVKHLMGWTTWYYRGDDYPVLQAIYPDLENRFPEDEGFDLRFAQPLMQPNTSMTRVEEDFWAAADPDSSLFDWKFPDPPHTGVYMSKAVHHGSESITFVSHDPNGDWQFLGDSMAESSGVLVCLHHPIDADPTLKELADLPVGWYAERAKLGEPWTRFQHEPEDDSDGGSS